MPIQDAERQRLESEAQPFRFCYAILNEVFRFDHAEAGNLSEHFSSCDDIVRDLVAVQDYLGQSSLDPNEIENLRNLIDEEIEVLSFSQMSRRSVIVL